MFRALCQAPGMWQETKQCSFSHGAGILGVGQTDNKINKYKNKYVLFRDNM